ncbi:MAG: phosphatidylserine/phosphatidylglycerophosphate/cardiolipin synthase family protein [Pseudobdellovibrio sp.]
MLTEEKIFAKADDFFAKMQDSIVNAKRSIYLETYIFEQDGLGKKILSHLVDAAKRKVRVQVLIDGVGSSDWTFSDAEVFRKQAIQFNFFHPLIWQRQPYKIWQSFTFQRIARGFSKINHRNHRKICIVDNKELFICSMNISDRHLESVKQEKAWKDIGVCIQGKGVERFLSSSQETWSYANHFFGQRWLRMRRQKNKAHKDILNLIRNAKETVWITNPYFVPDFKLTKALFRAASTGIDVKILVPQKSDILGLKFAMQGFYSALLKRGCKIFEYTPSILHAKILIIDNWVSVGSTNLDYRSLFYNLEADISLTDPQNIQLMKKQFIDDLAVSKQILLKEWNNRPLYQRLLQKFFLIFRGIF